LIIRLLYTQTQGEEVYTMGYPKQYSEAAIWMAETALINATNRRLTQVGEWSWSAEPDLLTGDEFRSIKDRFLPYVKDEDVLRLIGIAFSQIRPEMHMKFVNDGYTLALGDVGSTTAVVVRNTHECRPSYRRQSQSLVRKAAHEAVCALIDWRLEMHHSQTNPPGSWPQDGQYGADLIYGEIYRMIKNLADSPCCMRRTVEFVLRAVPDLNETWADAGLRLVPVYHAEREGRDRFITLRLTSRSPA
jgi:hypothetical protein